MKIKPLYRFFIWIIIIATIIISFLAYYFQAHEKDLFLTILQASLKTNISASDVDYDFPFGFSLDDFKIDGFIQAKKLSTQFDPQSIRKKKIILTEVELHDPIITWRKKSKTGPALEQANKASLPPQNTAPSDVKLLVRRLTIKDGQFHFSDSSANIPFTFQLASLQVKANELIFPIEPTTTTFQFSGTLIKKNTPLSGSIIKSEGWINFARKDMDSRVTILEKDNKVGLNAHAVAKNNDMRVEGKILAKNLFSVENQHKLEGKIDNFVINALSTMGMELGASFSFETKLDDFRLDEIIFSGSVSAQEEAQKNP